MRRTALLSFTLLLTPLAGGDAMAYEEPGYEVLEERDGYEIRRYAPYLVAETVVESDFDGAGRQAFRRLFGYISGKNTARRSLERGGPMVGARESDAKVKIKMTIPVVTTMPESGDGDAVEPYRYYFVMPSKFTMETLPEPNDPNVTLREVPARTVAALRYSGRANDRNFWKRRAELIAALARDRVETLGEPQFAVYNGPFTPWFMRRNEVLVEIAP